MTTRTTRTGRALRWLLALVLVGSASVNAYLALSEAVLWPAVLALVWLGVAAALVMPGESAAEPVPTTAREARALAGLDGDQEPARPRTALPV